MAQELSNYLAQELSNYLAQELSNYLGATVYAFQRRSNFANTWKDNGDKNYTKDYIKIEDEDVSNPICPLDWFRKDWDLALWNKNGAYYPPKSGSSPPDLPEGFFMFKKNEEPIKIE